MSERLAIRVLLLCAVAVALSSSAASAEKLYCLFCDYSDGSCCETPALIGGGCAGICANDYAGTGTCEGDQGPCRLRRGNCVYGWDKVCCEAKGGYIDLSCLATEARSEDEVVESAEPDCEEDTVAEAVSETDEVVSGSEVNACPADGVNEEGGPAQEDAFCFCPGGKCCGSVCYPGARCCENGVGYECCSSADCGGIPCFRHHCLDPD